MYHGLGTVFKRYALLTYLVLLGHCRLSLSAEPPYTTTSTMSAVVASHVKESAVIPVPAEDVWKVSHTVGGP